MHTFAHYPQEQWLDKILVDAMLRRKLLVVATLDNRLISHTCEYTRLAVGAALNFVHKNTFYHLVQFSISVLVHIDGDCSAFNSRCGHRCF